MFLILVCAVLLSLSSVIYPAPVHTPQVTGSPRSAQQPEPMPAMIPVFFGLLTPFVFTLYGLLQKHMISKRGGGFDNTQLIYCSLILVNSIILALSAIYWSLSGTFNSKQFKIGLIASLFDAVGKVASLVALYYGPGGPSCAIMALSGPFQVIVEALVNSKMIRQTEILALLLCLIGSVILIVPNLTKKVFCWPCHKLQLRK